MEKSIYNQYINKLKSAIAENALKSVQHRIEAQFETGMKKHELHLKQREIGYYTRRYLLAYAMLRGKQYAQCEPKVHHPLDISTIEYSCRTKLAIKIDLDKLNDWVTGFEAEQEVA